MYNPCPSRWLINLHQNLVWISFHSFCAQGVQWHWLDSTRAGHQICHAFRFENNAEGKVSTSSEKQSLRRRGEEVKRCCAVQKVPTTTDFRRRPTSFARLARPLPSFPPRVCSVLRRGTRRRRRISDGDATEANQAHAAVPRDHHRQILVRLSASPSLSLSVLFLFCWIIARRSFAFRPGRIAGRSRTGICASTRTASASSRRVRETR